MSSIGTITEELRNLSLEDRTTERFYLTAYQTSDGMIYHVFANGDGVRASKLRVKEANKKIKVFDDIFVDIVPPWKTAEKS